MLIGLPPINRVYAIIEQIHTELGLGDFAPLIATSGCDFNWSTVDRFRVLKKKRKADAHIKGPGGKRPAPMLCWNPVTIRIR